MYRAIKISSAFFLGLVLLVVLAAPAFASGGGGEGHDGQAEAKKSEAKPESGGSMFGGDQSFFVRLDPMILPIINDQGVQEVVSVLVALQVDDQQTIEKVNRMAPKLSDAYMRALYGKLDKKAYRNGEFIDVNKLKTKLEKITDSVTGPGVVKDVLIQGVNQRRFN